MTEYRREIDGLRALAIVPVLLFHAGFETFGGGFVGVDVFFVISGYLITTLVLLEMRKGTFSLLRFYERRARRILPALFLVMAVSVPPAWILLLLNHMKGFSQSLMAVSLFVSNFQFWNESGYFDTSAELKPLLHTWSLANEEQYYVLFPLVSDVDVSICKSMDTGIACGGDRRQSFANTLGRIQRACSKFLPFANAGMGVDDRCTCWLPFCRWKKRQYKFSGNASRQRNWAWSDLPIGFFIQQGNAFPKSLRSGTGQRVQVNAD